MKEHTTDNKPMKLVHVKNLNENMVDAERKKEKSKITVND